MSLGKLLLGCAGIAATVLADGIPRLPNGKPDVNGVWERP